MSDNPGIGKQVASSVVWTTHDCFILSSLPRSCLRDTYCTKLHPLGICESWREASRAAGVCAWTVHVMSHEWPCMLESICLLETYSREGDVWSKSLVMVDLKTDRCNRSWDLLWPYRVYPRLVLQAADEDRCQGWWADECVCGQQDCPMQRKSNGIDIEEEAICPCVSLCSRRCGERLMAECWLEYWWKCGWLVY